MQQFTLELDELASKLMKLDPIYRYLKEDEIEFYITEAVEVARDIARRERNARYMNDLEIIEEKSEGNYAVYSEIELKSSTITVFTDRLQQLKIEFAEQGIDVSYERLKHCFVLHEYFHYLEYNKYHFLSEKRKVCVLKLMGMKRMVPLKMLSEIGANTFLREIIGEPMDYITEKGSRDNVI